MVTVISGVALPGSVRLSQRGRATTTLLVLLLAPGAAQAHAGPQIRGITLARAQSPNLLLSNRGLIFGPPNDSAFETWMLLTQVTHAVECPATTTRTGMSCEAVWLDWEREILGGVAASSGAEGSAAVGGGDGPPAADSGGAGGNAGPGSAAGGVAGTTGQGSSRAASKHHGCSATATVPRGNALLLAAAGLLGWLRGRARRRRQRRAN
jgi:hypothetical protein